TFGYVDEAGQLVFQIEAVDVQDFSEGLAAFQVENQRASPYADRPSVVTGRTGFIWCGYLDKTGRVAIPPEFQACGTFAEGLAAVSLDGTWLYIDRTGSVVLRTHVQWAGPFWHGLAPIRDGKGSHGYIDKSGRVVFLTPLPTH